MNTPVEPRLDRPVFFISLGTLIVVTGLLLLDPEANLVRLGKAKEFMTHDIGLLFLIFVFGGILWLAWMALSKHGKIRFGPPGEPAAYSMFSWMGMLFCCGIGSNLLYFGTTEWVGYFLSPPPISGAVARSAEAADWAGAYSFFHWGISAWATYAMATLPIAYMLHVRKSPTLRISTACEGLIGERSKGKLGKLIDVFFIFGLVGGVGTSLGIGIPMISAVASDIFGISRGLALDAAILVGLTALFSASVAAGLDKGIKLLSDINMGLATVLLCFFLIVGPTAFILTQAFESLGLMLSNFVEMSLRTDQDISSTFAQDYTIFFWAWWLSWAPFMGLFIARISRGRTVREVVWGVVIGGSVGCWAGFAILGNATLNLVNNGHVVLNTMIDSGTVDAPMVVVELLKAQPFSMVVSIGFFVLAFIFVATSLDSAAFTLAATASDELPAEGQPARWHRLTWAFILAITALSLMLVGGLEVLQAASVVVGLPVLFILGMMITGLMRQIKADS